MRQDFERNWIRSGSELPSHCSMHFFRGTAFWSRFTASACAALAVLAGAACGPIGGVADDSSATAAGAAAGAAGTSASGGAAPVTLPDPPAFKVVGYQPSWAGTIAALQFDKLNYIDYAFATEAADGSVALPQPSSVLATLVSKAHQAGVRVLLSIGGWNNGNDSAFVALSADANARTKFATTLDGQVDLYKLDGVDIDWEFPGANDAANYTAMMQELSAQLKPKGKLITIAGAPSNYGSEGITADAIPFIDMVNIMAYDGGSGPDHSPYALAQNALTFWQSKGFPPDKLILGVPFYSRPSNTPYSALVTLDPAASTEDQIATAAGEEYYNGIPTVQAKTALAMTQGGGIMAWDLSQDTPVANLSLVSAIYAKIHATP
jgi:chitinase